MIEPGDRVRCPNVDDTEEVEATFAGPADPNQTVRVKFTASSEPIERDTGWVSYDDGTTARWPYHRIFKV